MPLWYSAYYCTLMMMAGKDTTVTQMRFAVLQVKLPSNQPLRWKLVGRNIIMEYSWDQPL